MILFLLRHGETDWNKEAKLLGYTDVPLNEYGKLIAFKTLKGMQLQNLYFDKIYSSPLSRAYQTAEILSSGIEIKTDKRLLEISFGNLEGTICKNVADCPMPPPNGESLEEVQARGIDFINELVANTDNISKNILIVSHGTIIRTIMAAFSGRPLDQLWEGIGYSNCGVGILKFQDGKFVVTAENILYY